jgi:phage I-like protein
MIPRFVIDLSTIVFSEGETLTRIPLAVLGTFVKGKVKFSVTKQIMAEIIRNFAKRGTGEVVIDYEHAAEQPEVAAGGPVPASGWLKAIDDGPDKNGILWGQAEFTEKARQLIAAKEYKYISPAINFGARDKQTGEQQGATITSVALVNRPFFENLPAVQLSDGWALANEREQQQIEEVPGMAQTKIMAADAGQYKVTCGECGKETMVPAGFMPGAQKKVALSDVTRDKEGRLNFSEIETGENVVIAGEVFHAMQVQGELDEAVKSGKILPAQRRHFEKLALSDLPAFREIVKSMKPQLSLSEHGLAGGEETGLDQIEQTIDTKVHETMKSANLGYGAALKIVASENGDLFRRRVELRKGGLQ